MEPAVFNDGSGGLIVFIVAIHDIGSPDNNLACFVARQIPSFVIDDFDVYADQSRADRAVFSRPIHQVEGAGGRRFRQAVSFQQAHAEFFFKHGDEFGGHGGSACDAKLE